MNKENHYQNLWKERIFDYENSGLTMNVWCEKNQVKIHQLQYWRRKFKTSPNEKVQLVPIELNNKQADLLDDTIKINAGKLSLEIHQGFSPLLLKEVMKVLMEIC